MCENLLLFTRALPGRQFACRHHADTAAQGQGPNGRPQAKHSTQNIKMMTPQLFYNLAPIMFWKSQFQTIT